MYRAVSKVLKWAWLLGVWLVFLVIPRAAVIMDGVVSNGCVSPRVLSIQSHVVHGYVGNSSATFPLQVLGYEVDTINSVQFSNHCGYKSFKGQVLDSKDLRELISGLRSNSLLKYTHILTGYVGTKSFLEEVRQLVVELKEQNKDVTFVCDPVMGDNGKLYVPRELLEVYREQLVPLADILTPNQFEAELLSGVDIKSEQDASMAIDYLLAKGAKTVIITSTELASSKPDQLILLAKNHQGEAARVEMQKFPAQFTGTGDLFAALLLAWGYEGLQSVCAKAVSTMQAVLRRTLDCALAETEGAPPTPEQIELKLVQSKRDIEHPPPLPAMN